MAVATSPGTSGAGRGRAARAVQRGELLDLVDEHPLVLWRGWLGVALGRHGLGLDRRRAPGGHLAERRSPRTSAGAETRPEEPAVPSAAPSCQGHPVLRTADGRCAHGRGPTRRPIGPPLASRTRRRNEILRRACPSPECSSGRRPRRDGLSQCSCWCPRRAQRHPRGEPPRLSQPRSESRLSGCRCPTESRRILGRRSVSPSSESRLPERRRIRRFRAGGSRTERRRSGSRQVSQASRGGRCPRRSRQTRFERALTSCPATSCSEAWPSVDPRRPLPARGPCATVCTPRASRGPAGASMETSPALEAALRYVELVNAAVLRAHR